MDQSGRVKDLLKYNSLNLRRIFTKIENTQVLLHPRTDSKDPGFVDHIIDVPQQSQYHF